MRVRRVRNNGAPGEQGVAASPAGRGSQGRRALRGELWCEPGRRIMSLGVNNPGNLMSQATSLSISLPSDLRAGLDAEAGRQRRSRSFVVAEVVRGYLDRLGQRGGELAPGRTMRAGPSLSP